MSYYNLLQKLVIGIESNEKVNDLIKDLSGYQDCLDPNYFTEYKNDKMFTDSPILKQNCQKIATILSCSESYASKLLCDFLASEDFREIEKNVQIIKEEPLILTHDLTKRIKSVYLKERLSLLQIIKLGSINWHLKSSCLSDVILTLVNKKSKYEMIQVYYDQINNLSKQFMKHFTTLIQSPMMKRESSEDVSLAIMNQNLLERLILYEIIFSLVHHPEMVLSQSEFIWIFKRSLDEFMSFYTASQRVGYLFNDRSLFVRIKKILLFTIFRAANLDLLVLSDEKHFLDNPKLILNLVNSIDSIAKDDVSMPLKLFFISLIINFQSNIVQEAELAKELHSKFNLFTEEVFMKRDIFEQLSKLLENDKQPYFFKDHQCQTLTNLETGQSLCIISAFDLLGAFAQKNVLSFFLDLTRNPPNNPYEKSFKELMFKITNLTSQLANSSENIVRIKTDSDIPFHGISERLVNFIQEFEREFPHDLSLMSIFENMMLQYSNNEETSVEEKSNFLQDLLQNMSYFAEPLENISSEVESIFKNEKEFLILKDDHCPFLVHNNRQAKHLLLLPRKTEGYVKDNIVIWTTNYSIWALIEGTLGEYESLLVALLSKSFIVDDPMQATEELFERISKICHFIFSCSISCVEIDECRNLLPLIFNLIEVSMAMCKQATYLTHLTPKFMAKVKTIMGNHLLPIWFNVFSSLIPKRVDESTDLDQVYQVVQENIARIKILTTFIEENGIFAVIIESDLKDKNIAHMINSYQEYVASISLFYYFIHNGHYEVADNLDFVTQLYDLFARNFHIFIENIFLTASYTLASMLHLDVSFFNSAKLKPMKVDNLSALLIVEKSLIFISELSTQSWNLKADIKPLNQLLIHYNKSEEYGLLFASTLLIFSSLSPKIICFYKNDFLNLSIKVNELSLLYSHISPSQLSDADIQINLLSILNTSLITLHKFLPKDLTEIRENQIYRLVIDSNAMYINSLFNLLPVVGNGLKRTILNVLITLTSLEFNLIIGSGNFSINGLASLIRSGRDYLDRNPALLSRIFEFLYELIMKNSKVGQIFFEKFHMLSHTYGPSTSTFMDFNADLVKLTEAVFKKFKSLTSNNQNAFLYINMLKLLDGIWLKGELISAEQLTVDISKINNFWVNLIDRFFEIISNPALNLSFNLQLITHTFCILSSQSFKKQQDILDENFDKEIKRIKIKDLLQYLFSNIVDIDEESAKSFESAIGAVHSYFCVNFNQKGEMNSDDLIEICQMFFDKVPDYSDVLVEHFAIFKSFAALLNTIVVKLFSLKTVKSSKIILDIFKCLVRAVEKLASLTVDLNQSEVNPNLLRKGSIFNCPVDLLSALSHFIVEGSACISKPKKEKDGTSQNDEFRQLINRCLNICYRALEEIKVVNYQCLSPNKEKFMGEIVSILLSLIVFGIPRCGNHSNAFFIEDIFQELDDKLHLPVLLTVYQNKRKTNPQLCIIFINLFIKFLTLDKDHVSKSCCRRLTKYSNEIVNALKMNNVQANVSQMTNVTVKLITYELSFLNRMIDIEKTGLINKALIVDLFWTNIDHMLLILNHFPILDNIKKTDETFMNTITLRMNMATSIWSFITRVTFGNYLLTGGINWTRKINVRTFIWSSMSKNLSDEFPLDTMNGLVQLFNRQLLNVIRWLSINVNLKRSINFVAGRPDQLTEINSSGKTSQLSLVLQHLGNLLDFFTGLMPNFGQISFLTIQELEELKPILKDQFSNPFLVSVGLSTGPSVKLNPAHSEWPTFGTVLCILQYLGSIKYKIKKQVSNPENDLSLQRLIDQCLSIIYSQALIYLTSSSIDEDTKQNILQEVNSELKSIQSLGLSRYSSSRTNRQSRSPSSGRGSSPKESSVFSESESEILLVKFIDNYLAILG